MMIMMEKHGSVQHKTAIPAASEALEEVVRVMTAGQGMGYIGEKVTQREHALQCAKCAPYVHAGADRDEVLGALFHDIGHIIYCDEGAKKRIGQPLTLMGDLGVRDHERVGGMYLRALGFSEKVVSLVESHVLAKRYLVWKDEEYKRRLSPASLGTLNYQGGPMSDEEARAFEMCGIFNTCLKMRDWDDNSKVVGCEVPGLDSYKDMILENLQEARLTRGE